MSYDSSNNNRSNKLSIELATVLLFFRYITFFTQKFSAEARERFYGHRTCTMNGLYVYIYIYIYIYI